MNQHSRKKNAGLYLKQGLLSLLLLGLTIYLSMTSSLTEILFPPTISNLTELDSASLAQIPPIIKFNSEKLYYTGYDNISSGEINGHYYYTLQDNYCLILLLDKQKKTPKDILTNYKGTFHITKNDTLYNQLTHSLAKDMDWAPESMRKITLPMVASQPDYHPVPAILFIVALSLCTIIFFLSAISNFRSYYYSKRRIRHKNNLP